MKRGTLLLAALVMPHGRPTVEIQGFHMIESKMQKRNLELRADSARIFKAENLSVLDQILALLYGEKEEPFELRGRQGLLNTANQDFQIFGESQVLSPDGFLFKTTDAAYNATEKILTSNEKVEAHNEAAARKDASLRMTGQGLKIELIQKKYQILQNVVAEQKIAKGKGLEIKAQNATVYPDLHQAYFLRSVNVKSEALDLQGERLLILFDQQRPKKMTLDTPGLGTRPAQKIKAHVQNMRIECLGLNIEFAEDGSMKKSEAIGNVTSTTKDNVRMSAEKMTMDEVDGVQRILMSGKVEIYVDERHATCQEAQFFPATGDIILEKIASVKKGREVLEGELIRFSTKNNKVFVEKAKGQLHRSTLGFPAKVGP